jgi:hypothetical protein
LTILRRGLAVMATALSAACTPSPSDPAPDPVPAHAPADPRARSQFSIVWTDAAGLDLLSAEGTYLRASVESLRLAAGNGLREAAYPGFWQTLTGAAKSYAEGFYELGPDDTLHGVARFEVIGFSSRDQRFDVGVCIFERQLGIEENGSFVFARQGGHHWELSIERAGDVRPPDQESGVERAPRTPVFGTWRTDRWTRPADGGTDPCQHRPTPGVQPGAWPALMPGSRPYVAPAPPEAPDFPGWPRNVT